MVIKNDILEMGQRVKTYMVKNKTLPKTVGAGKKTYSIQDATYIMSSFVYSQKEIAQISVNGASKSSGDKINKNVSKSVYQDMAKRCANYIKTNRKLPNYVTIDGKVNCGINLFIFALSKIIDFYKVNKKMPTQVLINSNDLKTSNNSSSVSSSLKSYLTSHGCSGMGQCTGYYCGCNSLQQAFYRLTGILVAENIIASVAGTTTAGTDHDGLNTAVEWFNKQYNQNIKITWKNFSDLGNTNNERWAALQSYIDKGAVFCHIKYRNKWGHYEVPKLVNKDDTLSILNSLGDKCGNNTYCGYIETRSKSEHLSYIQGISQKSIAILTKG